MISVLNIKNFAVVDETTIQFSDGFNVLTGETGAGKSILIDALNLFTKKKIPDHLYRDPDKKLSVQVMFEIDDEQLVFKREFSKNRSVSYINGEIAPFNVLKDRFDPLLNIYGQNEHIFLLNTKNHMQILDQFCQHPQLLDNLRESVHALKSQIAIHKSLLNKKEELREKQEFYRFQLTEIESLKMEQGDDESLRNRSKIISSSEEILKRSQELVQRFYQGESSVYEVISDLKDSIRFLADMYPDLKEYGHEVENFFNLIPELSNQLTNITGGIEFDETELNDIESRLFKLKTLETKYQMSLDQLLERKEQLKNKLDSVSNIEIEINEAKAEVDRLFNTYKTQVSRLRASREAGSIRFVSLIKDELEKLEMKEAEFKVVIDPVTPSIEHCSETGQDLIEFYFSSNPGQAADKIKHVASGGELSRLMLVLKSLGNDAGLSSYIFDEIDTGIGGKTAEFVGEKLKSIAEQHQVICISHLPQIAALADTHFLIHKEFRDGNTFSNTEEIIGEQRINEIGRLMAGSNVNESVLAAAKTLIERGQNSN